MKTRDEIYHGEAETLLRIITTYHALTYEQVTKTFPKKPESVKALITTLMKPVSYTHLTLPTNSLV